MALKEIRVSVVSEEEKTGVVTTVKYPKIETDKELGKIMVAISHMQEEITGQKPML